MARQCFLDNLAGESEFKGGRRERVWLVRGAHSIAGVGMVLAMAAE